MEPIRKNLSEITRTEWIKWRWQEEPGSFGDEDRVFVRGFRRAPDEARQALEDWDLTEEERNEAENAK